MMSNSYRTSAFRIFGVVFAGLICSGAAADSLFSADRFARSRVVSITCNYADAAGRIGDSIGTGFFINDDGYILTAKHVSAGQEAQVKDRKQWSSFTYEARLGDGTGEILQLVIFAVHQHADLMLLKPKGNTNEVFPFFQIASDKRFEPSTVVVPGFPNESVSGRLKSVRAWLESAIAEEDSEVELSEGVSQGHSGSPVVWRDERTVIGLITETKTDKGSGSLFVPAPVIAQWLRSLDKADNLSPVRNKPLKITEQTRTNLLFLELGELNDEVLRQLSSRNSDLNSPNAMIVSNPSLGLSPGLVEEIEKLLGEIADVENLTRLQKRTKTFSQVLLQQNSEQTPLVRSAVDDAIQNAKFHQVFAEFMSWRYCLDILAQKTENGTYEEALRYLNRAAELASDQERKNFYKRFRFRLHVTYWQRGLLKLALLEGENLVEQRVKVNSLRQKLVKFAKDTAEDIAIGKPQSIGPRSYFQDTISLDWNGLIVDDLDRVPSPWVLFDFGKSILKPASLLTKDLNGRRI
ncbi:MAG: serine protease, partial [Rubripirellula sp.]